MTDDLHVTADTMFGVNTAKCVAECRARLASCLHGSRLCFLGHLVSGSLSHVGRGVMFMFLAQSLAQGKRSVVKKSDNLLSDIFLWICVENFRKLL